MSFKASQPAMICSACSTPLPDDAQFCALCGTALVRDSTQKRTLKELTEALRAAASDRYRIGGLLGRGAMGAVFLAEDLRLERPVAIKVLRPDLLEDEAIVGRFQREARISARLDHPNIIPIYAVEQLGDFHYFVMKYVRGRSLDQVLAQGPLPVDRAVSILAQAASGLGHAHRRSVVHRDVKPSNLMEDDEGRIVVTDFGISKALEASTQYTSVGQILGTPRYLSPEQARGEALDGRADQYSLAVVGYELLTGRLPVTATSVHALMYAHIYEVPAPARTLREDVPVEISGALERALSKSPDARFASMEEFAAALQPGRTIKPAESAEAVIAGGWADGGVPAARRRKRWVGASIGLALAAAGAVLIGIRGREPSTAALQAPSHPTASVVPSKPEAGGVKERSDSTPGPSATRDSAAKVSAAPPGADKVNAAPVGVDTARPGTTPSKPARTRSSPARPAPDTAALRTPPPTPPTVGYLTINAVPYGTVSVDGVEVGDTPLVRYALSPGEHTFVIAREGYRRDSSRFSVTPGNEVRLSRTLTQVAP